MWNSAAKSNVNIYSLIYLLQFNGKKMYINNESHKDSLQKSRGTPYKAGHLP